MLNEAKLYCQAMDPEYEPELCRLIRSALIDMRTRGVVFEGDFTYTATVQESGTLPVVTAWTCTVTDDWIRTAALTYVKAKAPWTENGDRLEAAYESMLDRIMHTTGYHRGWTAEEAEDDG